LASYTLLFSRAGSHAKKLGQDREKERRKSRRASKSHSAAAAGRKHLSVLHSKSLGLTPQVLKRISSITERLRKREREREREKEREKGREGERERKLPHPSKEVDLAAKMKSGTGSLN
jgi:hypothetical protein